MSVVDGDWDELKKYNMTELYNQAAGITTGEQKKQKQKQDEKKKPGEESAEKEKEETTKDTKEGKEKEEPVSATAA